MSIVVAVFYLKSVCGCMCVTGQPHCAPQVGVVKPALWHTRVPSFLPLRLPRKVPEMKHMIESSSKTT